MKKVTVKAVELTVPICAQNRGAKTSDYHKNSDTAFWRQHKSKPQTVNFANRLIFERKQKMAEIKIKYNNKKKPVADMATQTDAIKCKGKQKKKNLFLRLRIEWMPLLLASSE